MRSEARARAPVSRAGGQGLGGAATPPLPRKLSRSPYPAALCQQGCGWRGGGVPLGWAGFQVLAEPGLVGKGSGAAVPSALPPFYWPGELRVT